MPSRRVAIPNIPNEVRSVFMQRVVEALNKLQGLGKNKRLQAVTRQDLIDLGVAESEDVDRLG